MYRAIGIKRKIILCLFKTKHKVRIQLQRYSLKYTSSLFIRQKSNVQKITEIMEEDLYLCLTLSVTWANSNADKIYTMQNNKKSPNLVGIGPTVHSISTYLLLLYRRTT